MTFAKPNADNEQEEILYTLFWAPGTGSLAVQAALEEIGAPYRLRHVDLDAGEQRTESYLEVNPNGVVPALMDGERRAYFESAGLVMLLCDRHPEAGLAPAVTEPARGHFYQWLLYMADTIYPAYGRLFHGERFSTDPADAERVREKAHSDLVRKWLTVDNALADSIYLLGDRFSACDIYLSMLATWFPSVEDLLQTCPGIARCARTVSARPAVARAMETHGQADDLPQA